MKEKTKGMATVIRAFTLIFVVVPLSWISQDGTAKAAGASTVIVCEESSEDATADWHVMLERLGEAIQNGRGENVNFSVGNTFEVPVEILQKLAGKNATLALLTNNGITFSISGRDVRRSDIPVSADLTFESVIPEEAKKQAGGNLIAKEFSMKEKDPYPFCINLHVGLGEENAGKHAVLYSYDEASGAMKQEEADAYEEERRLFYVAMTRAKEHLCLSAVRSRYDKETEPSRFLGEMGLDAASIFQKKIKKS